MRSLLTAAGIAFVLAPAVHAGWIATSRLSRIEADGDGNYGAIQDTTFNPFDESLSKSGSYGSAGVRQISSLNLNGFSVTTHTSVSSSSIPSHGVWGNATAISTMWVRYTVDAATQFQFTSFKYMAPGSFTMYIKNTVTNAYAFYYQPVPEGDYSVIDTIGPGQYEVGILVNDYGGAGNNHTSDPVASFAFIPAPSAGAAVGAGLLLVSRRRRT